ncbi:hypothetical protein FHR75_001731 [Kineococcus radiotolerans]|uniref:Uncharacterized protein n=2 Tax=Kineococcus radiotolerans TaxID=131568 RepID=A6W524_KINRD|nr:hypothetical protein [Kineococcus radiotolerans]ABS01913.1 hypothetical protein Krad_0423 [Kineococcus radiotolerans SRS30216 = ATCC BAA-149]MBB2900943.1 hypothetical protein [Kineococcus radiotolerans]
MTRHDADPDGASETDLLEAMLTPVLSEVLEDADALRCGNAVRVELAELPLPALRRRRGLLQDELRRVQHWTRLVRARLDLVVATACGPEELQVPVEAACHGGPLDRLLGGAGPGEALLPDALVERALDPGHGLRGLLVLERPAGSADLQEQLRELSGAQRRLAGYEAALLAELAVATDVLAERCRALFRRAGG